MGFWDLSDGETAKDTGTEYEVPGGNMEPIPDNSDVLAQIKAVKWETVKDGVECYINIQWQVDAPESVKNRVVFQKMWVADLDPQAKSEEKAKVKRDKARRMLASIDANAGGKLMESTDTPTDDSLALALTGKQMVIKCMIWEMPDREKHGEFIRGNWVSAVKPKASDLHVSAEVAKPKASAPKASENRSFEMDDEIPF